jgi:transcriptional regulator with XRE-family HTH domain
MMDQDFWPEKSKEKRPLLSSEKRVRSSDRLHYEAQVEVIRRQLGDLEKIREDLGLSQRKICQLLMVDPSAWTRWTKKGESAPPHIYRALQWYMILREKLPGLTPQYFVGKDPEVLHQAALQRIQQESLKRQEFEDALAVQTLNLERRVEELLGKNQALADSKRSLESQILTLQTAVFKNRVGFLILLVLFMAAAGFWFFRG